MKDIGNVIGYLITAVGGLISAITLFYKAFSSSKQNTLTSMLAEKDNEIKQKAEDVELYRKRWLKVEKENDRLKKKLEELENDD
ncbi:hypothetical protein [Lactobacillus crispatus]|uniref:hypothetical protein n=1 Tax=Lactobacillus crispatus TaxID=47770 RepID=UPI0001B29C71|nr:hypothetical protein [Lactobacillus crispatus]AZR15460.1 hypothetical protein C3K22_05495 [Lactobacillus crispatus]EEU19771.1 hypothetical protein HMPREF5045_00449 [Lactobacillus crispatus 125-2-CHN]MBI1719202.1 hypothetical protein [Lactobacillus crispatus]MCT7798722.1 hypothetical protein [Lactobacillus crispatus]MCZ9643273.1 hypothetical protein [Lactobacillus crispatus]